MWRKNQKSLRHPVQSYVSNSDFHVFGDLRSHIFFNGRLSPFSTFYKCNFEIEGMCFSSVEQYYQHAKAGHSKDSTSAGEIMANSDPGDIKRIGKRIIDLKWSAKKQIKVMDRALHVKFEQNDTLMDQLITTGKRQLIEANAYDNFWGIGLGLRDPCNRDSVEWNG